MTYGEAYDEALRKIARLEERLNESAEDFNGACMRAEHLEETNGKLCAEINRQERVIEQQLRKIDALEKERDQWRDRCIDAEVGIWPRRA